MLVKHSVQMIILNRRRQASETFCSDDHIEKERTGQRNILFR